MSLATVVAGLVSPVAGLIDQVHTSDEERQQLRLALAQLQAKTADVVLGYEARIAEARTAVIQAEAKGESWIQRTWRPITMLTFGGLIVADFMGWTAPGLTEAVKLRLYDIIQLGLGGYVIGRSAEKVVPQVAQALQAQRDRH